MTRIVVTPALLRTMDAINDRHVYLRYTEPRGRSSVYRYPDGSYSWNTMRGTCTLQTMRLENLRWAYQGPWVEEALGLKSRRWELTDLGLEELKKAKEKL